MLRWNLRTTFFVLPAAILGSGIMQPSKSQQAKPSFEQCDAMTDEKSRLKCFQTLIGEKSKTGASSGASLWRLLKTKDPEGKREITSIVRTADTLKSDLEIAGLMIRCGEASEIEVLLTLLRPLSLRSQPMVLIVQGTETINWPGRIVAPGELVQLPVEAALLVNGSWQHMRELEIAITSSDYSAHGIIPLEGLSEGLEDLRSSCSRK